MKNSMSLVFTIMLLCLGSFSQTVFGQNCDCPASTNQLTNPDFGLGDTGFYSDLAFDASCGYGEYAIGAEGRDKCNNPFWHDDNWDHTFGTSEGRYMIIDGPRNAVENAPNRIWGANTSIVAGETYTFYFHVLPKISDVVGTDLTLAFYMNGTNVSGDISIPSVTNWLCYNFQWTATYTGLASPQIRQVNNFSIMGYDYGLDDIYFGLCEETPEPCDVNAYWSYDVSPNDCKVTWNNLTTVGAGTTILGYHWEFGDGTSSDEAFPSHYYDESGIYEVCLTVYAANEDGECCTSKICGFVEITCDLLPCEANIFNIVYSINDFGDCILQFGATATANREIVGWFWDFGDGETGTGQNPIHDYASDGTYTVCVTIVLDDGDDCCSETFCAEVPFDCDGLPNTNVAPATKPTIELQRKTNLETEMQIFPNPSKAYVEIQFAAEQAESYDVMIFDLQGKLMHSQSAIADKGINRQQVDISNLAAGTYLLNIQLKDKVLSQKLIVL